MSDFSSPLWFFVFFLMIRRPPRSTLFPTRRSSDLITHQREQIAHLAVDRRHTIRGVRRAGSDRKSTRLNSSHSQISYPVFCLKKKEHTSELQSQSNLVCRLLLEKETKQSNTT